MYDTRVLLRRVIGHLIAMLSTITVHQKIACEGGALLLFCVASAIPIGL
jgi:hypothetical protein